MAFIRSSLLLLLLVFVVSSCARSIPMEVYPVTYPTQTPYEIVQSPMPIQQNFLPYKPPIQSKGLVVLDAGHGGKDLGTVSTIIPNFEEKVVNLQTTQVVSSYLQQMGYQIAFTRTYDVFVPLDKRASFANERNPAVFVSIHFNSAPTAKAEGIEVFYFKSDNNAGRSDKSKLLAQAILDEVIKNTKAKSRGVKHGDLAVIRETNMPAILIEGGFLTHEAEAKRIQDPQYLNRLAWGIAQGIDRYLQNKQS